MSLIKVKATRNIKHGRTALRNKKEVNEVLEFEEGMTYELEHTEVYELIACGALEVAEEPDDTAE